MAKHRPILKNTKISTTPVLVSHPKQVRTPEKKVFHFYCDVAQALQENTPLRADLTKELKSIKVIVWEPQVFTFPNSSVVKLGG